MLPSFPRRKDAPVAYKLLLLIIISSSLVTFIITAIQLFFDYKTDINLIENRIHQVEISYIDSVANSVWNFNKKQYELQLDGILNIEDIIYVEIINHDGKSVISKGQHEENQIIKKEFNLQTIDFGKEIETGKLIVIASLSRVYQDLLKKAGLILFSQTIKTILISTFIIFAFYHLVTRHLWRISEYVHTQNINSDIPLVLDKQQSTQPDELDKLVNAFNEMKEELQGKYKQVEEFNLKLEQKVQQRTETLNKTYQQLEKQNQALHKSQIKYLKQSQLVEQISDSVISTDLEGYILTWNSGSERLLGYQANEIIGQHITKIYLQEDFESLEENIKILKKNGIHHTTIRLLNKSSQIIDADLSLSLLRDEKANIVGMIGYSQDISQRIKAEKALEESNYNLQQYLDVIDKINIGLFVVDDDYHVRYMNNTMIKWFGNQKGKICYSAVAKLDTPCPYCKLKNVILDNKKVIYEPETSDGQSFDIVATSIKNADGTRSKMEVIRNVTDKKNAQKDLLQQKEKLAHQAHHDTLTGLPNRLLFNDRLTRSIEKSKRNNSKVALLFIDLDHFKEINDSLGHEVGDDVLKHISQRLNQLIRKEDTLARLGGDEFTIILEDLTQGQNATLLAQKIINTLSKPINLENNRLYVSSSIGISLYPEDGDNPQNLLKYADSAMYRAKDEGRNNFQFYSAEMTALAFERVVMESSFRESLRNEDFFVFYQPQINACKNILTGMEALVRWKHPTIGLVSPAKFIPLAETTGLIIELDQLVMKTAMNQIRHWYQNGLNPGVLALNLSINLLQKKNFISILDNLLIETQCKPQWIELEVTEGQIMTKPEKAIKILKQINGMGINIAVDDFGTGYSSLSYLKKLPINKLKIDQSFVRDLPDDEEDSAITRSVIALAKSLSLDIIAEGVETKEQQEFMVNNGCENIQGYYYSKPIPADKMSNYLKNNFHRPCK